MFQAAYNPLLIPYALAAFFCVAAVLWIFFREEKSTADWRFAVLETFIAVISASFAAAAYITDQNVKEAAKDLAIAVSFFTLPFFVSFVYHFVCGDAVKIRRFALLIGYAAALASALAYFSVFGSDEKLNGIFNERTALYVFSAVIALAIIALAVRLVKIEPGVISERIKTLLLADIIALIGAVYYFLTPAGNELKRAIIFFAAVAIFSTFHLYGLKKKQISEISDILKKIAVWAAVSAIAFVFLYFVLAIFRPVIIKSDFRETVFRFSLLFFLFWIFFNVLFDRVDRIARRQHFERQDLLKKFRRELITLRSPGELFDRIEQILFDCLAVENIDFYKIIKEPSPHLVLATGAGAKTAYILPFSEIDYFDDLAKSKAIFTIDDQGIQNPKSPEREALKDMMIKMKAHILIPLKIRDEAEIIIALGARKNRKPYAADSIKIINELLISINAAYSNARLYEDSLKWSKSLEKSVKERTAELEKANKEYAAERDELTRFNKVAYGREVKLRELSAGVDKAQKA